VDDLNTYIEHTNLKTDSTVKDIITLCEEAKEYSFATVCVNPNFVPLAKERLEGSAVGVCSVIAFPLGATPTSVKSYEAQFCLDNGADEIDVVLNIGEIKQGNWKSVKDEMLKLVKLVHKKDAVIKFIIEVAYLNEEEIVKLSELAIEVGADYLKTSTGFAPKNVTYDDVAIMSYILNNKVKIKAAGGIRDKKTVLNFIKAGAARIGTSKALEIINE
jgi:deoxyribose-phosphate aldolase